MLRKWTFMVYMAGDNGKIFQDGDQLMGDLQKFGWRNIADMASVGSTDEVAIVAQYDTLNERMFTPRLYIDKSSATGQVVEKIPPVNTGDPRNLTDFIVWAARTYPAEQYALVLWNHGTGWKEDDLYARYRGQVDRAIHLEETRSGGGKRLLQRALFMSSAGAIMSIEDDRKRGICYDDSSLDFLDNADLAKALGDAEKHLAVLGMDACLMSMIEVAYQVKDHADFMVGSQETELGEGWPYGAILRKLVASPSMTARELSGIIVEEFGRYYVGEERNGGGNNTQSAIDLAALPLVFDQVKKLSEAVADNYKSDFYTELALGRARADAYSFADSDFLDLRHLTQLFKKEYAGSLSVGTLADQLAELLDPRTSGGPIAANFRGASAANAHGLSIYFPARGYSEYYDQQVFSASGWNRVVKTANRIVTPPAPPDAP